MVTYALPGIFVMECLLCLMESYVIRCPEQSEWNIRAGIQCKNITDYFCLYNYIYYTIEEGCTGPEWDIPGRKRVYSGNFNTAPCRDTRYQPIIFVTNGNSDCIFRKSLCTEEGQTLFTNGTTRTDSTCRCDYTQGYAYVTVPRNKCYCRPSEEDCSCYLKKCKGVGYNLSADYECTNDITKKTDCPLMSANASEDQHIDMAPTGTLREDDSYVIRRDVFFVVLFCTFGMIVITTCFMLYQRLRRCPHQSTKEAVEVHIESGRMDAGPLLKIIDHNATNDQSADNAESKRMDTGPSLDTIEQNASNDESVFTICVMFHQRLARCLQQFTKQANNAESKRMDTGPSLDTIEQNASNDESAGTAESERIDTGPSLNILEQNASNDESVCKKL